MSEKIILKERKIKDTANEFIARLRAENEFYKYIKLKTHQERIKLTLKHMLDYDFVFKETGISKDKQKSEEFRNKGNLTLYTKANDNKTLIDTLKLYIKSIAFAPYPSVELALAYANRSVVLFELSLYLECLEDIERALALNYPSHLKAKVYLRKAECLIILKRRSEARDALYEQKHWIKEMSDLNSLKKLRSKMFKLQSNYAQMKQFVTHNLTEVKESKNELSNISSFNAEVSYASDAVAIEYNKDYGRHLIATRNIQPGEVIAVEKPYTLLLDQNKIFTHCSNCLKLCWANIPCERCIYAMYCSKKCRDDEWKKCHYVECNVFPYLIENDCDEYTLFSLRLAVLALKEAEDDMERLKNMVKRLDECYDPRISNFFQDGKLHSDKYAGVYNLSIPTHTVSKVPIFPCIVIYFLATRTEIFGKKISDLSALIKDKNVIFFGDLISRHQQILPINAYAFHEAHGNKYYDCGTALTSFCSLINHSCNPNVLIQSRPEHLILFAIYPIQKDEQLFLSYGPSFSEDSKKERQKKLKEEYFFECNCVACRQEWPTLDSKLLKPYTTLMKNAEDKAKIKRTLKKLHTYCALINSGSVDNEPYLIKELSEMIQVLHNYAPLPCYNTTLVIELLKTAYALTGNRYKSLHKREN